MSYATVKSRVLCGVHALQITIETHLSNGLPKFTIVGLPETSVRESKDRVRSAIIAAKFDFPMQRITVNLAPADIPKYGSHFDLAIALGILIASRQMPNQNIEDYEFIGELSLSGKLRITSNMIAIALSLNTQNTQLIIPSPENDNVPIVSKTPVLCAKHLNDIVEFIKDKKPLSENSHSLPKSDLNPEKDFSLIKGQKAAKQALELAASGGHSLLMSGPPGTGKTMLASSLPSILPVMTEDEAIETAILHLLSNDHLNFKNFWQRPFRSPHHSASHIALVGGSSPPKPGEISLAHNGILFLDELPEFTRITINALRQPIESGNVTIARAAQSIIFPARFQLVAAMNPCPCGYLNDKEHECRCTPQQIQHYLNKISGPILDRIDMQINVLRINPQQINAEKQQQESSVDIQARVIIERQL